MSSSINLLIILGFSILGMVAMIFKKIPVLTALSETQSELKWEFFAKFKTKIKKVSPFKSISYEIILQRILSYVRILTLKTDHKTFNWLQKLKEKAKMKKFHKNDNYWKEIKNDIK